MNKIINDEYFMNEALKEAKKSYELNEVPVGAVIVKDNKIIARAHNLKELNNNSLDHAELIAIKKASKKLNTWRLTDCSLYVTLEPCPMCAGAILQSRISNLYIGTLDPKGGACKSKLNLLKDYKFNHDVNIYYDICQDECSKLLKSFFKELRSNK